MEMHSSACIAVDFIHTYDFRAAVYALYLNGFLFSQVPCANDLFWIILGEV